MYICIDVSASPPPTSDTCSHADAGNISSDAHVHINIYYMYTFRVTCPYNSQSLFYTNHVVQWRVLSSILTLKYKFRKYLHIYLLKRYIHINMRLHYLYIFYIFLIRNDVVFFISGDNL